MIPKSRAPRRRRGQTLHPQSPTGPARTGLRLGIAATVAVVAVGAVVFALTRDDRDSAGPVDQANEPGVAHVHGLGVNPADGALFVATHFGMFRIAGDGPAERVGDSFQDTMGFTVTGPDRFLGSGHPDLDGVADGLPGRLGLIESTDAAGTWAPLSLSGDADFHGLTAVHEQVYGWDAGSGRFMVSADRQEWDIRSTIDLFGFAVDPEDPDLILGATPDGLVESTDGGRTWDATDGPAAVTVAWDATTGQWAIDETGTVFHVEDGDWRPVGSLPGTPQALLATADSLYAAAVGTDGATGIYRSTDGADWRLLYQDDPP
ncbi:MAG: F510_1955 family glycosylhydrolase [Acidimicrobiales bacterium]